MTACDTVFFETCPSESRAEVRWRRGEAYKAARFETRRPGEHRVACCGAEGIPSLLGILVLFVAIELEAEEGRFLREDEKLCASAPLA